jgi:hypothetical protein
LLRLLDPRATNECWTTNAARRPEWEVSPPGPSASTDLRSHPHITGMNLELDAEQAAALIQELHDIIENSRFAFSPRIRMLPEILSKLRPEPVCEPLPPPKHYAPPRATRAR